MGMAMAIAMGSREQREGLTTTYYPGTPDLCRRQPSMSNPGREIRSMDFSLRPSGSFTSVAIFPGSARDLRDSAAP